MKIDLQNVTKTYKFRHPREPIIQFKTQRKCGITLVKSKNHQGQCKFLHFRRSFNTFNAYGGKQTTP